MHCDQVHEGLHPAEAAHRSIGPVARTPVLLALLACFCALAAPAAAASRTPLSELSRLQAAGAITTPAADVAEARYRAATATLPKLTGRRRVELGAVLRNVRELAARGRLTASRVPLTFETLERNRQWWTTGRLLGYGERVGFPPSRLVWQSYPGQGIQLQWLATFGKANALWGAGIYDDGFRALLDESLALASERAGGLAFESMFSFDGGKPPWVSGLSTGTALQALARGTQRLGDPRYEAAAQAALGIFRTRPPQGILLPTAAGAHYLQYSFTSKLRILNGFAQSLNGLSDLSTLGADGEAGAMLQAGLAELAVELPKADTGAWSRYSVGGKESDLGYHTLLRDFLSGLCERTALPVACDTAVRFTADLTQPPVLAFATLPRARKGKTAAVAFTLTKVSSVTLTVRRAGAVVYGRTLRMGAGRRSFTLPPMLKAGPLALELRASDLAGNAAAPVATTLPVS